MRLIFTTLALLSCFATKIQAQTSGMHPEKQIQFVRQKIKQKQQPWLDAFLQLKSVADTCIPHATHALVDFAVPGYYVDAQMHRKNSLSLNADAFDAYACALAWKLTGEMKYAQKAIEVLNAWSKKNNAYSEADGSLVMSYAGTGLVIAARLMKESPYWSVSDKALFTEWVQKVYRKACNHIRNRSNNWADWGRFGSILSADYLNDTDEIHENIRLIKSDLFHKIAADGSMPEETRRQANGIWYTYFSLAPITAACWVAYVATGENLFELTYEGRSIKNALDYLDYFNRHPDEWKWFQKPNQGTASLWPGNLLEAMTGIYNDTTYAGYVAPARPITYPTHHYAWTFPTLMTLNLEGYR